MANVRKIAGIVLLLLLGGGPVGLAAGAAGHSVRVAARASVVGRWEAVRAWPVVAVHAAVMPTGEVLHFAYPGAEGDPDVRVYEDGTEAMLWDPQSGKFTDVSFGGSVFCGGHSFLPDGTLYVTGGISQDLCPAGGRRETYVFDPFARAWIRGPDMRGPRYYPSNLTRSDGHVVVLAGSNAHCDPNRQMELYDPGTVHLYELKAGRRRLELYPRVHLLSDGRLAHVGPEPRSFVYDFVAREWSFVAQTKLGDHRYEGFSVLLPGPDDRIMTCGGYRERENRRESEPTDTCEIIDFRKKKPKWRRAASMAFPRAHANSVLLPDHTLLVVGGGDTDLYDDPVKNAELYDPETDSFTLLPPEQFGRMYHSTAVLLPDGRVLSAGQDEDPNSPDDSHAFAEVYRPPYLFRGKRPKILDAPVYAPYGGHVELRATQSHHIESIVLIRPSAVTHSVNQTQRLVDLTFQREGGRRLDVEIPENANLAPPGFYMLFVVNRKGVPSKAAMVSVGPPLGAAAGP